MVLYFTRGNGDVYPHLLLGFMHMLPYAQCLASLYRTSIARLTNRPILKVTRRMRLSVRIRAQNAPETNSPATQPHLQPTFPAPLLQPET